MLFQRRSLRKDSSPGLWDVACSGHVDGEETYAEAAVRELGEELGYAGPPPEHLGTLLTELENETEMAGVFLLRSDGPFGLMLPEVIGLGIFSADAWPTPLTPRSSSWVPSIGPPPTSRRCKRGARVFSSGSSAARTARTNVRRRIITALGTTCRRSNGL